MKRLIQILIAFLLVNFASAITFYEGNVFIGSIDAKLNVNSNLEAVINYTFSGSGTVNLNFYNTPDNAVVTYNGIDYGKNLNINLAESRNVVVTYTQQLEGGALKSASFNPDVLFDNNANSARAGIYSLIVEIPYKLISYTGDPAIAKEDGANIYSWEQQNSYISSLGFSWSTQNVDIEVTRKLPQSIESVFTVETAVKNKGSKVDNVLLVTSFGPNEFEPASNFDEFKSITDTNDLRTEWRKEISSLDAGQTARFTYDLKVNNESRNAVLRPVNVYVNSELVAIAKKAEFENVLADAETTKFIQESVPFMDSFAEAEPFETTNATAAIQASPNEGEPTIIIDGKEIPFDSLTDEQKKQYGLENISVPKAKFLKKAASSKLWLPLLALILIAVALFFLRKQKYDPRLLDFINSNLRKGYGKEKIRQYLLNHGIDKNKVEKHLKKAEKKLR